MHKDFEPPQDEGFRTGKIDPVRASRDGHQFHEAWAARSALELLPPDTPLVAIAMEGFSREDEADLSRTAIEVADLVRYYGGRTVAEADRIEVVQFKYSISNAETKVRASDLKKTLLKFAQGEAERVGRFGTDIAKRTHYEFATNRPIDGNLRLALKALAAGAIADGDAASQADQLKEALSGAEIDICSFLSRLAVLGGLGSLGETRQGLRRAIANWSAPGDPQTRIRLRDLEHLVRAKAGSAGQHDNLIERVTVLAELGIDDERDLYPTEDAFPTVDNLVVRPILDELVARAKAATLPLVLHAEGGVGKTVLMQSLADRLGDDHIVVLFDGFGAGKWREPAQPRHLASRTLVHLANKLAGRGLCDLILPATHDDALLRGFRLRLAEAVAAARQTDPGAGVALVLDAIDHAAIAARDTGTVSFGHLLLKSLSIDPIEGVILIASCRSERLAMAVAEAEIEEFSVPSFSLEEASELILVRDPSATSADIASLSVRSGRNPRCLAAFLDAGRPYDTQGPMVGDAGDVLESLLRERITTARREAVLRGASQAETAAMLAGLAMLPPPVPIEELAAAQGLSTSDVESFATDLAPLLERTRYGLMFRDEPTETLIRKMSEEDAGARALVVDRLAKRQAVSEYAARALPTVLTAVGDVDQLVALAFDAQLPASSSEIGKQEIRLARIGAALRATARASRTDDLFRLALEGSLVAAGHERADRFLYEHPDLAAISRDGEALRRLFATRKGWPGGRHSALAVAFAFSGEIGEASRHAARSIDWHRHRPSKSEHHSERPTALLDHAGFSYVELLSGEDRRIFSWLGRNGDAFTYDLVDQALDLGDRHNCGGIDGPEMSRARRKLASCPLGLRGAFAAALGRSDGDRDRDRSFVRRLAATPRRGEHSQLPLEAMLIAGIRAADLGCRDDAKVIASSFDGRTHTVFSFDDQRTADLAPIHALMSAGLSAVLKRRAPALIDIAPTELLQMVPKSLRNRGPAKFEAELHRRLKSGPVRSAGKRRGGGRSQQDHSWQRDRYERQKKLLKHRVEPALIYAERVARLINAAPEAREAIVDEWLVALERDVAIGKAYPYREGATFMARVAGLSLLLTGSVLQALDAKNGLRLAKQLVSARDIPVDPLLWAVERLSRVPELHQAAMLLAGRAEEVIKSGLDTSSRLNDYGRLARAVWRTSPEDAAAYFRRGLDLAEALGADDFERANSLLQLTPNYRGPALSEEAAHALPRIFELQFSDADRYPWSEWAEATRGVLGLGALAAASRLDDRDTASLSFTLGPILRSLTKAGILSSDLAMALTCLAPHSEGRGWRIDKLVAAILPGLPSGCHEQLFQIVLREVDREDGIRPDSRVVTELERLAGPIFPADSWIRQRLAALRSSPVQDDAPPIDGDDEPISAQLGIAVGDAHAIDEAIIAAIDSGKGYQWPKRILGKLVAEAARPQERLALLRAVPAVAEADLGDKLAALEPAVRDWSEQSPAVAELLENVGRDLISHHADELLGTGWEVTRSWRRLSKDFGLERDAIGALVVAGLGPDVLANSGEDWLSLAAETAPAVSQESLRQGLERFLTRVGSTIPGEIGDGPWQARFTPPSEQVSAVAGLIWARLGHPMAAMRWRAGHVMHEVARAGRFDVLDAVIDHYHRDGGAFTDRELPFFNLNAKLWLLFGLGRVARAYPDQIAKHRVLLEDICLSSEFPHAAIREGALRVLRHLLPTMPAADASALEARLVKANRSELPPFRGKQFYFDAHDMPPDGHRDPDDRFYFDYDFQKYQVAEVARLFRIEPWRIRERVVEIVRSWDPEVASMHACPRPHYQNDRSSEWSSGYVPEIDRYGGQLAWHALQVASGEFLATRAVTKSDYSGRGWGGFLRSSGLSRNDDVWLSEWTDLTPIEIGRTMPMPAKERPGIYDASDARLLSEPLGLSADEIGEEGLVVAGYWVTPDHVGMHASSLLAPAIIAKAALLAGLFVEPFHRGLPTENDEFRSEFPGYRKAVQCWIDTKDHSDRSLDRYDPFAASSAQGRPSPGPWLRKAHGVSRGDDAGRIWLAGNRTAFVGEAWGGPETRLERRGDGGDWLRVNREYLIELLGGTDLVLAGFIRARIHHEREKRNSEGRFTHRTLGYLVDRSGRITIPKRIPSAMRGAINALPRHEQYNYSTRFRIIVEILQRSEEGGTP